MNILVTFIEQKVTLDYILSRLDILDHTIHDNKMRIVLFVICQRYTGVSRKYPIHTPSNVLLNHTQSLNPVRKQHLNRRKIFFNQNILREYIFINII